MSWLRSTPRRLHDAFGQAGRATGEHDVVRLGERCWREIGRHTFTLLQKIVPAHGIRQHFGRGVGIQKRNHHHLGGIGGRLGQRFQDLGRPRSTVDALAAVRVAITAHEQFGFEPFESIKHASHAKVRVSTNSKSHPRYWPPTSPRWSRECWAGTPPPGRLRPRPPDAWPRPPRPPSRATHAE